MLTHEKCPFSKEECLHLGISCNELYCGHAIHPNRISEMDGCPFKTGKKLNKPRARNKKEIIVSQNNQKDLFI